MNEVTIKYADISPKFGSNDPRTDTIWVHNKLKYMCMETFVIWHEDYHLTDKAKWWVWREIKANWAGMRCAPCGFMLVLLYSLTWTRIRYYISRVKASE